MEEGETESAASLPFHLPYPDSPAYAHIAVKVEVQRYKGHVGLPSIRTGVSPRDGSPLFPRNVSSARRRHIVADMDLHVRLRSERLAWCDNTLESIQAGEG